jgi:hypothetical protein
VIRRGRILMYTGIAVIVVGLSKAHAVAHEYSWSGSSRFAWSLGSASLLGLAAYALGLPEQPRTRRSALLAAVSAAIVSALAEGHRVTFDLHCLTVGRARALDELLELVAESVGP